MCGKYASPLKSYDIFRVLLVGNPKNGLNFSIGLNNLNNKITNSIIDKLNNIYINK